MAKEYICVKKCFYKKQLFVPGEIRAFTEKEEVPKHFKLKVGKGGVKAALEDEAKTLKELRDKELNSSSKPSAPAEDPEGGDEGGDFLE